VRARNRRKVLDAATTYLTEHRAADFSMRRLAEAAGVSVTTVYNLVGGRDEVVEALALDVLARLDRAIAADGPEDPLEHAWSIVALLTAVVVEDVPPALVAAVLDDERLATAVWGRWHGADALASDFRRLAASRQLDGTLAPPRLAGHALMGLTRYLRLWAHGAIDDRRFTAGAQYSLDVALLAGAGPALRERVGPHARALERRLPR
jgi:AcrR family transcriptional regulator